MLSMRQTVKMELLDSRCSNCKTKNWQCSNCQQQDTSTRKQAKKAAAAAKLATCTPTPPVSSANLDPSGLSKVHLIPDDVAKLTGQELQAVFCKSPIQPSPKARRVPPVALPSNVDPKLLQKKAAGPSVAVNAECAPKQNLRTILKSSPHNWIMTKIPRNGHCLFGSIVLAFKKLNRPELPKTVEELRSACANQLLQWKGIIPGLFDPLFQDGITRVQVVRGEKEVDVSLEDFCNLLKTNLYGGLDELMIIVQLFKVQIHIFHDASYKGGHPEPVQELRVNPLLPATDEVNAGNFNDVFF